MKNNEFSFELITQNENARLGRISTPKGKIDTPAFMPVGTQGTVKGVYTDDINLENQAYMFIIRSPYCNAQIINIDYSELSVSLVNKHLIFALKMTQFWRLFTSSYVQEFVDSVSMPTSSQLVEMFVGSDFNDVLQSNMQEVIELFERIPTFQEMYNDVKKTTVDQLPTLQDLRERVKTNFN